MTTQEIIEVIKGLSVLELNDLVKACEEEFGVSAAAGVVVAAGENVTKNFNSTNQYLVGAYTPPDGITVIGGKTGHTNTAGYNLVVLVQDSHHKEYVAVILGATTKDELYNQMNTLLSKI